MGGPFRRRVEPVAAEVHQPAAAMGERGERVELVAGEVLGVRAGDRDAVGGQGVDPLGVEVVVGDHVDLDAHGVEPVGDHQVEAELVHPPGRAEVGDRSGHARVDDRTAVAVHVVRRLAELRHLQQEEVGAVEHGEACVGELVELGGDPQVHVGVCRVGRGGHDVGHRTGGRARSGPNDEGHPELRGRAVGRLEPHGVARTRQILWEVEGERRRPCGVGEVVVVEVHGRVRGRVGGPRQVLAGPRRTARCRGSGS